MGRAEARDYLAVATLWVPFLAVVVTWLLWNGSLPEDLPRQWNGNGVSTTAPTWLTFAGTALISLAAAVGACFAIPSGAAPNRRKIFLAAGFAAGLSSSAWLMTSLSALTAVDGAEPQVGAFPLLVMGMCAYGFIPFFLARKWTDEDFEEERLEAEARWLATIHPTSQDWPNSKERS